MSKPYPTEAEIRSALIERAAVFCRLTGKSRSEIGLGALNDGAVITQIIGGRNFTMETYRKVMTWLDANWPAGVETSLTPIRSLGGATQ
jgi:hypothetical protein